MENYEQHIERDTRGRVVAHRLMGFQVSEMGLEVIVLIEWEEDRPNKSPRARKTQLRIPASDALLIGRNLARVAPRHGLPSLGTRN